jgi:hypothetical protein
MDPTRATSPAGSQGSNDTQPDLPHSMLFVPKFTQAREPRPLNRDGTPVNPELNREPSPADVPPLPLPRASRAREGSPRARPSTSAEGTRIADLIAAQAGGARVIGTISRTLSPPSPAPSPASSTRTLETASNPTPSSESRPLDPDERGA